MVGCCEREAKSLVTARCIQDGHESGARWRCILGRSWTHSSGHDYSARRDSSIYDTPLLLCVYHPDDGFNGCIASFVGKAPCGGNKLLPEFHGVKWDPSGVRLFKTDKKIPDNAFQIRWHVEERKLACVGWREPRRYVRNKQDPSLRVKCHDIRAFDQVFSNYYIAMSPSQ